MSNPHGSSEVEVSPAKPMVREKSQSQETDDSMILDDESNNKAVSSSSIVAECLDHPCWGGPRRGEHDLPCLLRLVQQSSLIIRETPLYIVMNKPPDLRMDGIHAATVHKLLTYWYPPPSLQHHLLTDHNNKDEQLRIASVIASLSKHNDLSDNELRPCHQLDYATSGVLLVARTQLAAAVACRAFAERSTKKEYVAVVHGHISCDHMPLLPASALEEWRQGHTEERYRKQRRNVHKDTFAGFMPTHAIFNKWKAQTIKRKGPQPLSSDEQNNKEQKTEQATKKPKLENVTKLLVLDIEEEEKLVTLKWSAVKQIPKWKLLFEEMATRHNNDARQIHEAKVAVETEQKKGSDCSLPHGVFCVEGEESSCFYIHAPIAEVPNSFRMAVQHPTIESSSSGDNETLDFKPALTRCVIEWKGTLATNQDRPVTKVKLFPWTGRRHQLRVHMMVAGHAILGDETYDATLTATATMKHRINTTCDVSRMCLHAHSLTLPLQTEGECTTTSGTSLQTFTAHDPFVIQQSDNGVCSQLVVTNFGQATY
eukprot:scaffold21698_cov47-Attheya_sp.AAC.2